MKEEELQTGRGGCNRKRMMRGNSGGEGWRADHPNNKRTEVLRQAKHGCRHMVGARSVPL